MTCDVAIPLLTLNPSGGVRMVGAVANALAARGLRVALSAPAGESPLPLRSDVARVVRAPGRLGFVASLPPARAYLATGYQTPLLIAAGRALAQPRARIIHLIQNDEPVSHIALGEQPVWLKPVLRAVALAGYRVPAYRIAVSSYVAQRVGEARVQRIIPPGIEERFLAPPAARPPSALLTVGVLAHPAPVKGMAFALDAFAQLRGDRGLRLLAFDGANPAPLPAWVEPFSRVAAAAGGAHDIAEFYRTCGVFVFPSLVEGFGLPPLEAMACGAAVVVSDSGGPREYARDGENCLVVPPADPAALAGAVRRLAGDDALRARLAADGAATAARFTATRFAQECAAEIERVLDGSAGKS